MYYKIWSRNPSHIWDYIAFNQEAEGKFIKYEMKDELAVDYVLYETDQEINHSLFNQYGFVSIPIDYDDIYNSNDGSLKNEEL
ncbi:hypothetical protein [Sporosalibacterium faouarense]|uniref:hypothetical protein n=1 Tax=Sporosalibacterium faouarense TaxID=516123 RepID=UPI00141C4A5D|nr:hypothetical protein [Sporosalibacterium faouarense]MTI49011.1 hypothetical protein [Bacillota bacterium]